MHVKYQAGGLLFSLTRQNGLNFSRKFNDMENPIAPAENRRPPADKIEAACLSNIVLGISTKVLQVVLLSLSRSLALASDSVNHLVGPGGSAYEKLSAHTMQEQLVASAEEYQKYGSVERAAHRDMAFPRDIGEYRLINGSGVIWVTSHSHVKAELPIRNLRIDIENIGTIGLDPPKKWTFLAIQLTSSQTNPQ